jgi:hypothetical protein
MTHYFFYVNATVAEIAAREVFMGHSLCGITHAYQVRALAN